MARFFIFISMFSFSIPDLCWAIFNLLFAAGIYLIGLLMGLLGFKKASSRTKLYGLNIALAVDQFMAVKAMGQDPDVTISMALGVAKVKHKDETARVNKFWLIFGDFVNFLFSFQEDHVVEAIEREEKAEGTVISIYREKDKIEDKSEQAA